MKLKDFWPLKLQWPPGSGYDAFTRPVGVKTIDSYDLIRIWRTEFKPVLYYENDPE
jgi:hypothetical protein